MSDAALRCQFLAQGESFFGAGRIRLETVLGSCVSVAVWHPQRRLGGLNHFLLPTRRASQANSQPSPSGLYADEAMKILLDAIVSHGTLPREYQVSIIGGGAMYSVGTTSPAMLARTQTFRGAAPCAGIGCDNIAAARELLHQSNFATPSEDTGGMGSRQVRFDLWTGALRIRRGEALPGFARIAT